MSQTLLTRANYYAGEDLFTTDINLGVMRDREGTRMIDLTNDFLLGFQRGIEEECGEEATRLVLYGCGRIWGERHARRMDRALSGFYGLECGELPFSVFVSNLRESFRVHGWGMLTVDTSHEEHGILAIEVQNAIMASVLGSAELNADSLLAGILAGLFSHFTGVDLTCLQTACEARGAEFGQFLLAPPTRLDRDGWDAEDLSHNAALERLMQARG